MAMHNLCNKMALIVGNQNNKLERPNTHDSILVNDLSRISIAGSQMIVVVSAYLSLLLFNSFFFWVIINAIVLYLFIWS